MLKSVSPYSEKVVFENQKTSIDQAERLIEKSEKCFKNWRWSTFEERSDLLKKIASELNRHKQRLTVAATLEMGKPIAESILELEKCAANCEFYASHGEEFLKYKSVEHSNFKICRTYFEPLGPLLLVMPWNFPYWQETPSY